MELPKAPFDGVCYLDIIDLSEDWGSLVAYGATQNKLSYCIDYFLDKSKTMSQMNFCGNV